ncbi:MAG: hypothetical protein QG620_849 [Patescibacteria group bacterium]|nr:hypothetical protein [Patescibacteria group bacterium]
MNQGLRKGIVIGVIIILMILTGWYFLNVRSDKANVRVMEPVPEIPKTEAIFKKENEDVDSLPEKPENLTWVTDWGIVEGGKNIELKHKECGFGLSIPEKWKVDQKDNLYLSKEKGYSIVSNELKAAPYLSFTIICGNSILIDDSKVSYKIPRIESEDPIVAERRLSGDNTTKIQYLLFTHNDKKYSIEIKVNYSYGSLVGEMFTTEDKYKSYWKEEQQGIDAILKTFQFLDEK